MIVKGSLVEEKMCLLSYQSLKKVKSEKQRRTRKKTNETIKKTEKQKKTPPVV